MRFTALLLLAACGADWQPAYRDTAPAGHFDTLAIAAPPRASRGVTVVELMIVLLIVAVLSVAAGPMLAGVLVPICLEPVTGLAASPAYVGPVVLAWLVMHRVSRRWAVPVPVRAHWFSRLGGCFW